jgi:predicted GNAT family acetyltransferase
VQGLLGQHAACSGVWTGEGYYFARPPQPEEYPDVLRLDEAYVVSVASEAVSRAWTQDGSAQAAELAVETQEAYRRQGYGRQAASAWAAAIIGEEKVAFYSHLAGNAASQRLARSLGVAWYARWAGYAA